MTHPDLIVGQKVVVSISKRNRMDINDDGDEVDWCDIPMDHVGGQVLSAVDRGDGTWFYLVSFKDEAWICDEWMYYEPGLDQSSSTNTHIHSVVPASKAEKNVWVLRLGKNFYRQAVRDNEHNCRYFLTDLGIEEHFEPDVNNFVAQLT